MRRKSMQVAKRTLELGGKPAWQLYQTVYALRCAADECLDAGETILAAELRKHAGRLNGKRLRLMTQHQSKTGGKIVTMPGANARAASVKNG